jgi:hypothetical protein
MGALVFLIAIAIAAVVFYLYLQKLFSNDVTKVLPKQDEFKEPVSKTSEGETVTMDTLSSREPEKFLPNIDIGHNIEPGINDDTYKEIIMAPSAEIKYQAEDYFEGSPEEDRAD